jgi:hypothetical protein
MTRLGTPRQDSFDHPHVKLRRYFVERIAADKAL